MGNSVPIKRILGFPPALFQLLGASYFDTGCSEAEVRILHEIYVNNGCSAAAVGKRLCIDKAQVCREVKALEKQGFVYRQQSDDDKRVFHLYLTDRGITRTEEYMRRASDRVSEKVLALNEPDREKLMQAFETIMCILKQ